MILKAGSGSYATALRPSPLGMKRTLDTRIGEQIGEGELMVNWEAYPTDVASLIHVHPSQNESITETTIAITAKSFHAHN